MTTTKSTNTTRSRTRSHKGSRTRSYTISTKFQDTLKQRVARKPEADMSHSIFSMRGMYKGIPDARMCDVCPLRGVCSLRVHIGMWVACEKPDRRDIMWVLKDRRTFDQAKILLSRAQTVMDMYDEYMGEHRSNWVYDYFNREYEDVVEEVEEKYKVKVGVQGKYPDEEIE